MKNWRVGAVLFLVVVIIAFNVGSYIIAATFFGSVSLLGLIVLIESIPPLRWIVERTSRIFDALIFLFTIFAVMGYGLNVAASLTVCGLGYTLVYAPYVRERREKRKNSVKKPDMASYRSHFDAR